VGILRTQWDALPQSSKSRLANISTDEGFKDATTLAFRAGLGAEEVFELVTACNAVRSSTRQQAVVKNYTSQMQDRIQETGGGVNTNAGRRPPTPKQNFNRPSASSASCARTLGRSVQYAAEKQNPAIPWPNLRAAFTSE
jgi:hypothetical protein